MTVLKPLHGDEPMLEDALASFCAQAYAPMQIVFGVHAAGDAAVAVVERLRAHFPAVDMALVVDPACHGPNRKVDNLINMLPHAKHEIIVISDADIHAAPDMLRSVVGPLSDPAIGLTTTLYTGRPASRSISRLLGAAGINQSFLPGALLGRALGREDCLGAVMAIRRTTLAAVGGLASLSPHLADDAVLGRRVRALGLRVALAGSIPATSVVEESFGELYRHELRWGRTVRGQAPIGYPMSMVQAAARLVADRGGPRRLRGLVACPPRRRLGRADRHRARSRTAPVRRAVHTLLAAAAPRRAVARGDHRQPCRR